MKILITIITSVFLLFFTPDKNDDLIIIHGKSLGKIVLGKTTKKEVENYIGKGKKETFYYLNRNEKKSNKYVYPDRGIELCYTKGDTIFNITIKKNCKYKTDKGIGIGSSIEDVKKAYGEPENIKTTEKLYSMKSIIIGIDYKHINYSLEAQFQNDDKIVYKVDEIDMYNYDF